MKTPSFPFHWACRFWLVILALYSGGACALEDTTLSALELADGTEFASSENKGFHAMAEMASALTETADSLQRLSFDARWDTPLMGRLSQDWRLVLSNRFDSRFYHGFNQNRNVNSLREAYVSYRPTLHMPIDIGRINTRYGVALGHNPTDFLGRGTVRSATSADPETLRNNRLGNAMVRLQRFWDRASATAIWSPKISEKPSDRSGSLDWGTTNSRDRLLLVGSYRITENFNPQLLYLQEEQRSPQMGANLSRVLSRSALIYVEWAGGRQPLSWQSALPESQWDVAWRNRIASGITWTGENSLTLRLEGHYNGSADSKRAVSFLSSVQPYPAAQSSSSLYGDGSQQVLDWMMPRRSALMQAYWKDVVDRYDLNLIWQRDLQQQKNMGFAELRRHLGSVDLTLQWQKVYQLEVAPGYQIRPERRWQLSASYYF